MCDMGYINELKSWRWFLWLEGEYMGDFSTKKDAMNFLNDYKQRKQE